MGSISDSGIGCAGRIWGWRRSALAAALALPAAAQAGDLTVTLQGLRNARGLVQICLTRDPAHFPDCGGDPQAFRRTLPAARAGRFAIGAVPPGRWALSLIHDENANGRLDTFLGIPREGFGFSRNPHIRFGAPGFDDVAFAVGVAPAAMTVEMKYML